jgi:hypothetical protein
MSVILHCVAESNGKLRVRIQSYKDDDGKIHDGVYDNSLNCQFPRALRAAGRTFTVPAQDVSLRSARTKYFYHVKPGRIHVEESLPIPPCVVWEASSDCVVCMEAPSDSVFAPCGHACTCSSCSQQLEVCCLCRTVITHRMARGA